MKKLWTRFIRFHPSSEAQMGISIFSVSLILGILSFKVLVNPKRGGDALVIRAVSVNIKDSLRSPCLWKAFPSQDENRNKYTIEKAGVLPDETGDDSKLLNAVGAAAAVMSRL